jgi:hypothetical protein
MTEKAMFPERGQTWRSKSNGSTTRIYGRRMRAVVHISQREHGYVETSITEFMNDYEFEGCDHSDSCCGVHGTHTSPHMGCILR